MTDGIFRIRVREREKKVDTGQAAGRRHPGKDSIFVDEIKRDDQNERENTPDMRVQLDNRAIREQKWKTV